MASQGEHLWWRQKQWVVDGGIFRSRLCLSDHGAQTMRLLCSQNMSSLFLVSATTSLHHLCHNPPHCTNSPPLKANVHTKHTKHEAHHRHRSCRRSHCLR